MKMKTVSRAANLVAAGLFLTGFVIAPKLLKSQDLQTVPFSQFQSSQSAPYLSGTKSPKDVNNYAVDCFRFNGSPTMAVTYFKKALECGGGAAVDYNLGTAYFLAGKFESAISEFKKAIDLNPSFAHAYYNMACAQLAGGDVEGAMASFKKAISLDPTNSKYSDGYRDALVGGTPAPCKFVKIQ